MVSSYHFPMSLLQASSIGVAACLIARLLLSVRKKSTIPNPPSPPSEPIIGHARLLAGAFGNEPYAFHELGKKYGGIVFMSALGQNVAIVNDSRIAEELLDKRASIYWSRSKVYSTEIMGATQLLPFLPAGDDFKRHRRMFQRYFRQDKVLEHRHIHIRETQILLRNLLNDPTSFMDHALQYATGIIIDIGFGHTIEGADDPYVKIADDVCTFVVPSLMNADPLAAGIGPLFPILQYMPSWFPLAHYAIQARSVKKYVERLYNYPLTDVERQMAKGTAKPSFLATQLEELRSKKADPGVKLEHIQGAAAIAYIGGADTTSSSLIAIIAAMLEYPQCQQRVHEELDKVVGINKLPEFADRENLPYLERFLQEVARQVHISNISDGELTIFQYRWHPVVPMYPHQTIEDDVYDGMFIPKGTIVIANGRGMTLDDTIYENPYGFNPDRYLPKPAGLGEPYPISTWGFGRRVCPGRHLANDSVWIAAARFAATMTVKRAIGPDGQEIVPNIKFTFGGSTNRPEPFQCHIAPRNELTRRIIVDGI